jgi:hypothetical protein
MTTEVIEVLRVGIREVVQEVYYPKVEEFVKYVTGASRVIIFDHTVRKSDPEMKKEDNPSGKEQPATVVSSPLIPCKLLTLFTNKPQVHCDQYQCQLPGLDVPLNLIGRVKTHSVE